MSLAFLKSPAGDKTLTHENIAHQAGRDGVTLGWNATFQR
jgi:hypothetical protein